MTQKKVHHHHTVAPFNSQRQPHFQIQPILGDSNAEFPFTSWSSEVPRNVYKDSCKSFDYYPATPVIYPAHHHNSVRVNDSIISPDTSTESILDSRDEGGQHRLGTRSASLSSLEMSSNFDINKSPPFVDPLHELGVQAYEVMRIHNVPFNVNIAEVKAFVARLTQLPLIKDHHQGYPVHIIMERSTGKTMECFVEFQNTGSVAAALHRAEYLQSNGTILKIGPRHVDVEFSSEGALCAALFPKAKSIHWDSLTGIPVVMDNLDPFSEGFQGFLTVEEMTNLCKHATMPHKSTFSQRCPQRVYESMISTLYKFPWNASNQYSINARNFLWSAYMDLMQLLVAKVQPYANDDPSSFDHSDKQVGLNENLLRGFLFAGLNVPTFSLRQKFAITAAVGPFAAGCRLPEQASIWPFQSLTLPEPRAPADLDEWLNLLETGYQICTLSHSSYGYENLVKLKRDDHGFFMTDPTVTGRSMPFHNLIAIETVIMKILIEAGRQQWCNVRKVPYEPLKPFQYPLESTVSTTQNIPRSLEFCHTSSCQNEKNLDSSHDNLVKYTSSVVYDEANGFNELSMQNLQIKGLKTGVSESSKMTDHHLNPSIPSFVPNQPWSDSVWHGAAVTAPVNRASSVSSAMPSGSTWGLVRGHALNSGSGNNRRHSDGTKVVSIGFGKQFDPFVDHSVSGKYRKTSLDSQHLDMAASTITRNDLASQHRSYSSGRFQDIHKGNPTDTWTHASPAQYKPKDSSGLTAKNIDAAQVAWDAVSNAHLRSKKANSNPFPTSTTKSAFQGRKSFDDNSVAKLLSSEVGTGSPLQQWPTQSNNGWLHGSPRTRGSSRSSIGRKSVFVHDTIDEEGDIYQSESFFSGPSNVITEDGGVRL